MRIIVENKLPFNFFAMLKRPKPHNSNFKILQGPQNFDREYYMFIIGTSKLHNITGTSTKHVAMKLWSTVNILATSEAREAWLKPLHRFLSKDLGSGAYYTCITLKEHRYCWLQNGSCRVAVMLIQWKSINILRSL